VAVKLSDIAVKHAKQGITWDLLATGLGLKVTASGRRIWIMQLVWPGQRTQSRRTLGRYPGMGLDEARKLSRDWYELVKQGVDPSVVKAKARHEARVASSNTFGSVVEAYIRDRAGKHRRAERDAGDIRRELIKPWGELPISSITPRDVRELLARIGKRSGNIANSTWGHLCLIFKYAVHHEFVEVSPCASLSKKLVLNGFKPRRRTRTLDDDEVVALWHSTFKLPWPHGHLFRWLLLSGCRLSEATDLEWTELHPELRRVLREVSQKQFNRFVPQSMQADHMTWTIPGERTKSGALQVVPLTHLLCDQLIRVSQRGRFVFSHRGDIGVWYSTDVKRKLDALMLDALKAMARKRGEDDRAVKLPHWTAHDLRRVVRTNLAALGIARDIAERVLGHDAKDVLERIYNRHQYTNEIHQALIKWNDRLADLTAN
jgi:integrase